jgi:hypothetical protein
MLDIDEWALSQHLSKYSKNQTSLFLFCFCLLVKIKLDGHEIPNVLPDHLVPPSKRHLVTSSSGNNGMYPTISNTSF